MRTRTLITAAVTAAITIGTALPAAAVPSGDSHRENVLRGFCTSHRTTECVVTANDDDGVVFRDRSGRTRHPQTPAAALRYLRHHAVPCRLEDSPHCFWDAASRGNGVGSSFMVTGGHREGAGTVFYLALA